MIKRAPLVRDAHCFDIDCESPQPARLISIWVLPSWQCWRTWKRKQGTIINESLKAYICSFAEKPDFVSGEIFAKILADNDDRSRHGVLIPKASYEFFPELTISNHDINSRVTFPARDLATNEVLPLSWIYYQRYPERRITRLGPQLDDRGHGRRLLIFTRFRLSSGESAYVVDVALEHDYGSLSGDQFGSLS